MSDDISVQVNDKTISGWTRIRLTRGIERMPADFHIELTEYYAGDNSNVVITPGSPIKVFLGKDLVLTGYVDDYITSIKEKTHFVSIYGRSKSEDIVDCSAEYPNAQILSQTAIQVISQFATVPYGIPVYQNVIPDSNKNTIPQTVFVYTETAVEVIERICRYAQLLFYDVPDGGILLTTASSKKAACGFTEGVNVQEATGRFTMNRYSQYICELNSVVAFSDNLQQNSGQNNSVNQIGTPQIDSTVLRNRKKYILLESGDIQPFEVTTSRAQWEKNRRFGKAWEVTIKTDTWRDSANNLWEPNTLVDLMLPTIKVFDQTWLISEVTYSRDEESGTTATLVMNPPGAFIPEPIVLIPGVFRDIPAPKSVATSSSPQDNSTSNVFYPAKLDESQLVIPTVSQADMDAAAASLPNGFVPP